MDFPPIIKLISATFDEWFQRKAEQSSARAPAAAVTEAGMGGKSQQGTGPEPAAARGKEQVGRFLDTFA